MGLLSFLFTKKIVKEANPQINKFVIEDISNMTEDKKLILREQYNSFKKELEDISSNLYQKSLEQTNNENSNCPKCKSTNVNNRIKKTQGEIKGTSFSGMYSSSASVSGSIDTNPVNKCNDCQHEWEIAKPYYSHISIENIAEYVCRVLNYAYEAYEGEIKFDSNNLDEKYSSLQEKRQALVENLPNNWAFKEVKQYLGKYSIELVQYIVNTEMKNAYGIGSYYYEYWQKGDKSLLSSLIGISSIFD